MKVLSPTLSPEYHEPIETFGEINAIWATYMKVLKVDDQRGVVSVMPEVSQNRDLNAKAVQEIERYVAPFAIIGGDENKDGKGKVMDGQMVWIFEMLAVELFGKAMMLMAVSKDPNNGEKRNAAMELGRKIWQFIDNPNMQKFLNSQNIVAIDVKPGG